MGGEFLGFAAGAFRIPRPQIPAFPRVGFHAVFLIIAVGTVIMQFDGQVFRIFDVIRLRCRRGRRFSRGSVGSGIGLRAVHPRFDGTAHMRVTEFGEFPHARLILFDGSRGRSSRIGTIHDSEMHCCQIAVQFAAGFPAVLRWRAFEWNIRGAFHVVAVPHLHAGCVLTDAGDGTEVDGHFGFRRMVARVGHARLLPVPADVDHSGADLCRIFRSPLAPVPVRGVRFPGLCGCEMVFHRA